MEEKETKCEHAADGVLAERGTLCGYAALPYHIRGGIASLDIALCSHHRIWLINRKPHWTITKIRSGE